MDPEATIIVNAVSGGPQPAVPAGAADPDAKVAYVFGSEIARGGMGSILEAQDCKIGRTVAVKIMLSGMMADADQKQRFINEAAVLGMLAHPNIVPVYDIGRDSDGHVYYTMKLVKGRTLQAILNDLCNEAPEVAKHYTQDRLLTVFQKVCDAIAFAHSKGVIHRDLKPENVMVGEFGEVLVMDWGLAKVIGNDECRMTNDERAGSNSSLSGTLAGSVMGTPQYMAPEQARGEVGKVDERADIYALGAILYHILALRPAVTGGTAMEVVGKVARGEFARLPTAGYPDSLVAVVHKAMAHDRMQRYASVAELQTDIAAYQGGFATSAERAGLARQLFLAVMRHKATTLGVAAVLIVGAIFGTRAIFEGKRAEREAFRANSALADLRKTAPTFCDQAKLLADGERFPEALEKIGIALTLNPGEPAFHARRGDILQSMERFSEAASAYSNALRLNPQDPHAAANIDLSRSLAAATDNDGSLSLNTRLRWRDALVQQGRAAEAIFAGRGTGTDAKKMMPSWQGKLDAWLGMSAPKLRLSLDRYELNLPGLSLTEISPLRGMPLRYLDISNNPHLKDLSPLVDCPLTDLVANRNPGIMDLSALKGMKLQTLNISTTGVRDLSPLAGIRTLEALQIYDTGVSDLAPIRQARLKTLWAYNTKVRSLEPLRGQPLESLSVNGPIESLDPVGDAPLAVLNIVNCGHQDLATLRTRHLRQLYADRTMLDHLELLSEFAELEVITLPKNLTDPGVLRKLPRLQKIDTANLGRRPEQLKDATDFWREYDAKQAEGKK